jgi:hypothetical protein
MYRTVFFEGPARHSGETLFEISGVDDEPTAECDTCSRGRGEEAADEPSGQRLGYPYGLA